MPTLEQVCKRLFGDFSWFIKCIIGGLLVFIPVINFFALGYIYKMMDRARRGQVVDYPEWQDWGELFLRGFTVFVIMVVLAGLPVFLAYLISLPFAGVFGIFARLPMIPALLLAAPLTAAGIYRYQRTEDYRDAFRLPVLIRMLEATRARFFIPTFAFIGLLVAGSPLMPFVFFTGAAAVFTFYASFFNYLERVRLVAGRAP